MGGVFGCMLCNVERKIATLTPAVQERKYGFSIA